jgi:hypothetical protein
MPTSATVDWDAAGCSPGALRLARPWEAAPGAGPLRCGRPTPPVSPMGSGAYPRVSTGRRVRMSVKGTPRPLVSCSLPHR